MVQLKIMYSGENPQTNTTSAKEIKAKILKIATRLSFKLTF
jgi:hypothetical protein